MVALCPSLRCSCRKTAVSCRKAEGLVMELRSPRFATIVEIELSATVGWKWGCQPCSWPSLAKWDALPKGDLRSTCLFKESIPAIPFRNSKHPLPGRSNFLQAAARSTLFALGLQKIPSLRCSWRKNQSYDIMQKSRGFGHGVVLCDCCQPMNHCRDWAFSNSGLEVGLPALQLPMLAKCEALPKGDLSSTCLFKNPFQLFILGIPSIHSLPEAGSWEPQYVPPALLYAFIMLAKDSMPSLKILLYFMVMELGSPRCFFPFAMSNIAMCQDGAFGSGAASLSAAHVRKTWHWRKDIFSTFLSKESLPFVKSKRPLLTRSLRFPRAAARSTCSAVWLHHAHPFVAAAEKNPSHAEKQRVWSRSCGLQDLLRNIPISDGSMWPLHNTE